MSHKIRVLNKRIPKHANSIRRFLAYLEESHDIPKGISIKFSGSRYVEDDRKETTLARYYKGLISVALGGCDETLALFLIAHEVKHALQDCFRKKISEPLADSFGMRMTTRFYVNKLRRFSYRGKDAQ